LVRQGVGSPAFQGSDAFSSNMDVNILQGSIITDASGNVISLMTVAQKPQIKCSIKFLDVSRTTLKQLGNTLMFADSHHNGYGSFSGAQAPATGKTIAGFGGSSGYTPNRTSLAAVGGAALSDTAGFGQSLGTGITQILTLNDRTVIALSALEESQKVRSLAEPNLTMLSGEKSSFLAGGEVPIPVLNSNGQISISYHEFGVRLNLIGTVTDDGKIHMQVAPEISAVDPTAAIKTNVVTVPGFRTRRMQTTLELRDGESFILAGLFSQDETLSSSQFPGLGNLPIVGNFLKNKWKSRSDNEMVVIIKPEISMIPNNDPTPNLSSVSSLLQPSAAQSASKPADKSQETQKTADISKAQPKTN
jgi:pilus assembly protein CpaC